MADRSDMYIVGIDRLMRPVATFACIYAVRNNLIRNNSAKTYEEEQYEPVFVHGL